MMEPTFQERMDEKYCCAPMGEAWKPADICMKPVADKPFCRLCGTPFEDGTCPYITDEEHSWWLNGQNALHPEDHTCQPISRRGK